jgi:hypothetical protein
MTYAKASLAFLEAALIAFTIACGGASTARSSGAMSANVKVLSEVELGRIRSIGDRVIVFSEPVGYDVGDIIVAGISEKSPDGILRKIVRVSDDRTGVDTEQATIEDIVPKASLEFDISPDSGKYQLITPEGTYNAYHQKGSLNVDFDFKDVVLFDADRDLATRGDQIVVNGRVKVRSQSSIRCEIGRSVDSLIDELSFENKTELQSMIQLHANVLLAGIREERTIAQHRFPAFSAGLVPGTPVPLIVRPVLDIQVGLVGNVCPIDTSLTHTLSFEAAIAYNKYKWERHSDFSDSFDFTSPEIPSLLEVRAYVNPRLTFYVYGVVGPYAGIETSLLLNAGGTDWEVDGTLDARLGINTRAFSRMLEDAYATIADYSKVLARGELRPEDASRTTPSLRGRVPSPVTLSDYFFQGKELEAGLEVSQDGNYRWTFPHVFSDSEKAAFKQAYFPWPLDGVVEIGFSPYALRQGSHMVAQVILKFASKPDLWECVRAMENDEAMCAFFVDGNTVSALEADFLAFSLEEERAFCQTMMNYAKRIGGEFYPGYAGAISEYQQLYDLLGIQADRSAGSLAQSLAFYEDIYRVRNEQELVGVFFREFDLDSFNQTIEQYRSARMGRTEFEQRLLDLARRIHRKTLFNVFYNLRSVWYQPTLAILAQIRDSLYSDKTRADLIEHISRLTR